MAPTLRIGVLGAGPIAQFAHFEALPQGAQRRAVRDLRPRRGPARRRWPPMHRPRRTFTDYDDDAGRSRARRRHRSRSPTSSTCRPPCRRSRPASTCWSRSRWARSTAECVRAARRGRGERAGRCRSGTMRRFDPGIAFAQRFVREELGDADRAEGVVLRLGLPLPDDRHAAAASPGPARTRAGRRATRRPTGGATHARPRQPPDRHRALSRRRATSSSVSGRSSSERGGAHCWFVGVRVRRRRDRATST